MAPSSAGGEDRIEETTAKHLLDSIGKKVQEKAKGKALPYKNYLHGFLSRVQFSKGGSVTTYDPCKFDHNKDTNVTSGQNNENPCHGRQSVRFSDTKGAECYRTRIKGSEKNSGACAPFRKLHMCDRNLEHIEPHQITSTHNLLVDVLLAAKHEGESLVKQYEEYKKENSNFNTNICTILARSFADIGDIIRGKDLFLGHQQRKRKLEENLKNLFKNLYKELTKDKKNGAEELQKRYENDGPNYYQLREDWWNANRNDVWKAITCEAKSDDKYFRESSSDKGGTYDKCRCASGNVLTNFDYVPQYLRWFEEWAEDFCTKRKHKLENAIKNCRGKYQGKDRYCSRNGYDCINTVRIRRKLVKGSECDDCYSSCTPFVKWIDDKKQEFLKQKKKYANEINGSNENTEKKTKHGPINNLYVKDFYDILKVQYEKVNKFLELLSKEQICQSEPQVEQGKASLVKFTEDNDDKTFSHTEYCEPCPWCGLKDNKDGTWERKEENHPDCPQKEEKIFNKENTTDIPVLTPGKGKTSILQKYKKFCANGDNSGQIKKWECHYEEKDKSDDCVLHDRKKGTSKETIMSYHPFFWKWVTEMLDDSIEWRKELNNCLKKENKQCIKLCHGKCGCFAKWVKQKKNEFIEIKEHFKKQKDIGQEGVPIVFTHDDVLEGVLQSGELFKNIEKDYGDAEEIKHIKEIMANKNRQEPAGGSPDGKKKTTIDLLLEDEEKDANTCTGTHNDDNCNKAPKQATSDPGRSALNPRPAPPDHSDSPRDPNHVDPEDEEDEEEEEEEEEDKDHQEDTADETEGPQEEGSTTQQEEVEKVKPPCEIVQELFKKPEDFKDACGLKYGPKAPTSWKCIPSDGEKATSGGDQKATGSGNDGAICVPPRRRKLYVGGLTKWAKTSGNTGESQTQAGEVQTQPQGQTPSQSDNKLRDAFIESAAVETFFLWHKYKADKEKEEKEKEEAALPLLQKNTSHEDPQSKLEKGEIPEEFKRQMFYTLADYKDILFSGDKDKKNGYSDILRGDKVIQERESKIKEKIKIFFEQNDEKKASSVPASPSSKDPKTWWKDNAKHIWNAMVCALTYKENEEKGKPPTQIDDTDNLLNKLKDTYDYQKVELEQNSGTEARTNDPLNNPKLTQFVKIPTYFRWLHEWGSDFCGKRARMLEKIKYECRNIERGGHQYCSGDGHDCTDDQRRYNNMFANLDCRDCYKECRKYKKWIDIKFEEFHKQEKKYEDEYGKLTKDISNGNDNTKFFKEIENRPFDQFLTSLKHCKDGQNNNDQNNIIDFKEPLKTFGPLEYCRTCPPNKVTCNGGGRRSGRNGCTPDNGNKWQSVFNGNGENGTTINVHMIDRRGINIDKKFEQLFKDSYLFKSLRNEQWECRFKEEKMDVCHLINFDETIDLNDYTTFKVFLEYWLDDFLYGYYLLKKRKIIEKCTQKEGKTCNENSKNDCACVGKWVQQKGKEWESIKHHFQKQKNANGDDIKSKVKFFFQQEPFESDLKKVKGNFESLEELETSLKCNGSDKSQNGTQKDIIECILKDLQKKIGDCKSQPGGKTETQCENPPLVEEPPLDDDTSTTSVVPEICKDIVTPTTPEEEEKEPPEELPTAPDSGEDKAPEKKIPVTPPKTQQKKKKRQITPTYTSILPEMVSISAFPLSVGIAFATFTYFYLKKKTKSSVGNLFQILQIPKSDYDIPTKLSPNRYIPYTSGKYRGKRYIYLEGDSGTDSGYTDHYSDITSSSESEYEELDINDIYPYKSPKYKTLIEVVLEPSKRDTQNDIPSGDTIPTSDTPPPTSGNTIPTSDIPNTPSDTPSPITDEEWNTLKHEFISQYLPNTEPNMLGYNVDNNTNPKTLHVSMDEKPFITSIHDRNLLSGEEYNYDMSTNSGNNNLYSGENNVYGGIDPTSDNRGLTSGKHDSYSGIDLINDSLSGDYDIYDEVLKRKENELFGTNHVKQTSIHSVAKPARDDPIHNQLELFHKWLDRHRDMCEQWNNKEELLDKLKEEWENETHSGNKHSDIPSGKLSDTPSDNNIHSDIHPSDIPSGKQSDIPSDNNIHSDIPYVLNTDVSIQIHMDNPKSINEFTNMDTILENLDKYNEPYYDVQDDIYYDVNDDNDISTVDTNAMDVPSKVQIEMDINTKLVKEKYPIGDVWDI